MPSDLLREQTGNDVSPAPDGFEIVTSPLTGDLRAGSRTRHFDGDVYDLSGESHLTKLLKVLLGETGVGGLQRETLLVRLQQSLSGTHFFDLDSFYGTIFGQTRSGAESLVADPYAEAVPIEEWDQARIKDGAYRARASRLAEAIHLGATAIGLKKFAEAYAGFGFDIHEQWVDGGKLRFTWDDHEGDTYEVLEPYTWDELEYGEAASTEYIRNHVTLYPLERLSDGDRFDLETALERVKPANMVVKVSDHQPSAVVNSIRIAAKSSSERWEIRQKIKNTRVNGILPFPGYPEDEFVSPPVPAWSNYSGEAWTVLDRTPRMTAYSTQGDVRLDTMIDPAAQTMTPQAIRVEDGIQVVALPEFALKSVSSINSGRNASDGIISGNPYYQRNPTQPSQTQDNRRISSIDPQKNIYFDRVDATIPIPAPTSAAISTRFWTTPNRRMSDETNDVLEMRFDEPVDFNHISFEFAHFPCRVEVQYWSRSSSSWVTLDSIEEKRSIPQGFPNQPPEGAPHPFHYGEGHWAKRSLSFSAITARLIRFVLKRRDGIPPYGTSLNELPYPVGIRSVDVGFRVNSIGRVPHVPVNMPVATTKNSSGLMTKLHLDKASATYVQDDSPTAWFCEPQPVSDSVVNLYLGVGDGVFPQIVNRLSFDPVHVGPMVNMYSTLDQPKGTADSDPVDEVVIPEVISGPVNPVLSGNQGLSFATADSAFVGIDSTPLGGNSAGGSFWFGTSWEFLDFSVEANLDKFVTIFSSSIPSGHVNVAHGIEKDSNSDPDAYTIFATINGKVYKLKWTTGFIPAKGDTMRLIASVQGGTVNVYAQIEDGEIVSSTSPIDANLSRSIMGEYDPSVDRRPPDWYETNAKNLPLFLRATSYKGGTDWISEGSQDGLVAHRGEARFIGDRSDVEGWFMYFPGSADVTANRVDLTDATSLAAGEQWGKARIQPFEWSDGTKRYIMGNLDAGLAVSEGIGFGVNEEGYLEVSWAQGLSTYYAAADLLVPHSPIDPVDVGFTFATNTVRFFWKKTGDTSWTQLGSDIDADAIVFGTATVDHTVARAWEIGRGGLARTNPDPQTNFHGAIFSAQFGTGTGDASDLSSFATTTLVDVQPDDYGDARALAGTYTSTFTTTSGHSAEANIDTNTGSICGMMFVPGPCFIMESTSLTTGIEVNDQIADMGFDRWFNVAATIQLPFTAAGRHPIVTKRAGVADTDKGWGVYVDDKKVLFSASDGTTEIELEAGDPYLVFDGVAQGDVSIPSDPELDLSDGFDITFRASQDDWNSGTGRCVFSRDYNNSWYIWYNAGQQWVASMNKGAVEYLPKSTDFTPPANGEACWMRVKHDSSTGITEMWTAPDSVVVPPDSYWTELTINQATTPVGDIDAGSSAMRIGSYQGGIGMWDGNIYAIYISDLNGSIKFETDAGDIPYDGLDYTSASGHALSVRNSTTTAVWHPVASSTEDGGLGAPTSIAVAAIPSALRIAAKVFGSTPNENYGEDASTTWTSLTNFDNSEPVRIFADGSSTFVGAVFSVYAGSGEQKVSDDFQLAAASFAGAGANNSIGSSWTVTANGELPDGTTLLKGDVLFEQPSGGVSSGGEIRAGGVGSLRVPTFASEIRYGSAVHRGISLKLLGSVMGYGVGPDHEAYLNEPDPYHYIPLSNNTEKIKGTFLRHHPSYYGWANDGGFSSIGFMGGPPDAWSQSKWTPVGQFPLMRGAVSFDDILCVGIKLEFTDLVPEPYASFLPIDLDVYRIAKPLPVSTGRSRTQVETNVDDINARDRFYDQPNIEVETRDVRVNYTSPTAALAIIDGTVRSEVNETRGYSLGLQKWQHRFAAPMQDMAGNHSYTEAKVRVKSRTAYFVGIRTIDVQRVINTEESDTPYYLDTLLDTSGVDVENTNFEIEPGQLYTPEFSSSSIMEYPRSARSIAYQSRTTVKALQFSTQQSPSTQVIPDDEFLSTDLSSYDFESESRWHRSGDSIIYFDQSFGSVRVTRDPSVLDAFYAPDTPIVHPPVTPVLSSGFARTVQLDFNSFGGISSPAVLVSPKGVLWAGARVAAAAPLSAPLYLRVYDVASGAVLVQEEFTPEVGLPTEVSVPLTSYRADPFSVQVRVEQDGPYMDSWIMYALSAFDQGLLWEFSNDGGQIWIPGYQTRGLRWGVIEFPTEGSSLMWRCVAYRYNTVVDAIQLRPWYSKRIGAAL